MSNYGTSSNPHPPNRGPTVLAVTTTTLVLASVFVAARLISRTMVVKRVSLDDYLIILAWLMAFLMSFAIDFGTSKGLGRHDVDIKVAWVSDLRKSEFFFSVLYNPALMATKSSILVFYLRLSRNTTLHMRIASYITLVIVNTAGIVLTFLCIFQCRPVSASFYGDGPAKCFGLVTLYLTSAPVNIITDLAILILPIPVITSLNLPQRQKNILVATFGFGIFVTLVDIVRIYYLQQASMDFATGSIIDARIGDQVDFAWFASKSLVWTAVEVNVGIMCACVPPLKPLLVRLKPHWIGHVRERVHSSSHQRHLSAAMQAQVPSTDSESACGRQFNLSMPHTLERTSIHSQIPSTGNQRSDVGSDTPVAVIGLEDFLSEPQVGNPSHVSTARTFETANSVYFGFVNMKRPKSMLQTRGKETIKYCTLVTVLFFLWGFSFGLLNVLSNEIAKIAGESEAQTLGLNGAYFGAYLFGPFLGWWVLRRGGFKATFITGLCIYGVGTLMWWPSAVLKSFPGFFVSNFVVGFGLSVLETAANPFLALCGPEQHAEFRLLLAQGVQGVASVIGPLLAEKVFFRSVHHIFRSFHKLTLVDVQFAYLAITIFDTILALFFYYMPLPEATDDELDEHVRKISPTTDPSPGCQRNFLGKYPVVFTTLAIGTAAQFLYVSAQEVMSVFLPKLLDSTMTENFQFSITSDDFDLIAQTLFTVSRFIFAGLTFFVSPRKLLVSAFVGSLVFSIAMITLPISHPNTIATTSLLVFFFEGPLFPLIFAISIRGLGGYTKAGSAILTAAVSGGGFLPFVMHAIIGNGGISTQHAFVIVVALFAASALYAIYINLVPTARKQVDSPKRKGRTVGPQEEGTQSETMMKILSNLFARKNGAAHADSDAPSAERQEQKV